MKAELAWATDKGLIEGAKQRRLTEEGYRYRTLAKGEGRVTWAQDVGLGKIHSLGWVKK